MRARIAAAAATVIGVAALIAGLVSPAAAAPRVHRPATVTCNSTDVRMTNFVGNPEGSIWLNTSDTRAYLQNAKTPTNFCQIVVAGGEELQQNGNNRCLTGGAVSVYYSACIDSADQTWGNHQYGDGHEQWIDEHNGKCMNGPTIGGLVTLQTCGSGEPDAQAFTLLH